jgi:hypothetical protein
MKNTMQNLRQWFSKRSIQLFSVPYLPNGLISATLVFVYTDLIVLLLSQPSAYWIDQSRASSNFPFVENLLSTGVFPYALVALLYLALLWMLLTILTRNIALALWLPFSFIHLSHILSWLVPKMKLTDSSSLSQGVMVFVNGISALLLGILLVKMLLSQKHPENEPIRIKRGIRSFVLGAWVIGLIMLVAPSAIWPRGGWTPLHPVHTPGRRALSAVAYDPVRQRVVLFGGVSELIGSTFFYEQDTWEWDGTDWIEMKPKTIPLPRAGHMMAYDEKHNVVIMFGGEDKSGSYMLSDTWVWDGKDWRQMLSMNSYPTARRGGQLFYDPRTEKVILSGGFYYSAGKVVTPVNDMWAWNGKDWEYVTSTPKSLMITNPNVAYDALNKRTILFDYKQVMSWNDGQWSEIETRIQPPSRAGTWLAADLTSGKLMIFGGIDNNVRRDDTWMLEGGIWKELHPNLTPSPRDAHVMFFDARRNSFILYGGMNNYALADMWEYVLP